MRNHRAALRNSATPEQAKEVIRHLNAAIAGLDAAAEVLASPMEAALRSRRLDQIVKLSGRIEDITFAVADDIEAAP